MIVDDNIAVKEASVTDLKQEELLIAVKFISVDPAHRIYLDPSCFVGDNADLDVLVKIGDVVRAWVVGEVIASRSDRFPVGSFARDISGRGGVQEYCVLSDQDAELADPAIAPLQAHLGALGMPGITAYAGMVDIGQARPGKTVVVSGAAGAVGSVAGQLAKILGARVVGIAGGQEKCDFVVRELGFDACINYKEGSLPEAIQEHCSHSIDVYFDNVGGAMLDACLGKLAMNAQVVGCGAISGYNDKIEPLRNYMNFMSHAASWTCFHYHQVVTDRLRSGKIQQRLNQWVQSGALKHHEYVLEGLEGFVPALKQIYQGLNIGKTVLRLNGELSQTTRTQ
jgi:hypothetical protein